ncbi:MAG: efflux RND transporter periplasmic adaptor subunit [Hyphomicrobium sp.]|nr:efflux RND transporter periplasmic adaptor subunit [Hyphomicrobium sp.]
MRRSLIILAGFLAVLGSVAAGYRLGTGHWPSRLTVMMADSTPMPSLDAMSPSKRPVLYWRDPDGKPAYAASQTKTTDGRDYVAVHDNEEPPLPGDTPVMSELASAEAPSPPSGERKIKFYRNPMGLPDTSSEPKKDWMGMDYIPVYDGEDEDDGSSVKVSLDKVQRAGVKSEPVVMRKLARPVSAPGVAKIDERTLREITLRADAYIEKLYVAETGKHVKAGEPLFRIYSPDIVKAEVDYKTAMRAATGQSRGDAEKDLQGAAMRLENLGVPDSVIEALKTSKDATPMRIDWPSPVSGVVIDKKVIEGQKVDAGAMLYQIADLSSIWVIADVAEQDIGPITVGAPATAVFRAYPNETFEGKVTFILHELEMQTRTAKVRIEIANPDHRIRHDMYADVTIDTGADDAERLVVPVSAVLDTGVRQIVLVDKGDGRFEPRPVKLGYRGNNDVEITEGLAAGDMVVTSANFLIDAESNLKAALKGFTADVPLPGDAKPMSDTMSDQPMSGPMSPVNAKAEAKP